MNDRDIWLNLSEKAATMKEGVKFAGMMFDKEIWFVKDEAVSGFLRGPSAHPQEASQAQQQFRAELRDRFAQARAELRERSAMAALAGMLGNPILYGHKHEFAKRAYEYAEAMMKARNHGENNQ